MFDVSWGELFIVTGVSIAVVGRKDLPKASYFLGSKIGQIVGFLQGARARADRFATNNELNALQNELRSGLRELDTVKGELAIAASSRGLIGRGLASTVSGRSSLIKNGADMGNQQTLASSLPQGNLNSSAPQVPPTAMVSNVDYFEAAKQAGEANQSEGKPLDQLPPRSQSVAAVAEEEWEKQGIGFKSRAERGIGGHWGEIDSQSSSTGTGNVNLSGSSILSDLMQQSLIHDQYDRAVQEQDQILQSKINKIQTKKDT